MKKYTYRIYNKNNNRTIYKEENPIFGKVSTISTIEDMIDFMCLDRTKVKYTIIEVIAND